MYFNEELLTDEGYRQLNGNQQYELIVNHCRDIEGRIRSAASRPEALHIAETACSQIRQACHSAIIKDALASHVADLISRYWG